MPADEEENPGVYGLVDGRFHHEFREGVSFKYPDCYRLVDVFEQSIGSIESVLLHVLRDYRHPAISERFAPFWKVIRIGLSEDFEKFPLEPAQGLFDCVKMLGGLGEYISDLLR